MCWILYEPNIKLTKRRILINKTQDIDTIINILPIIMKCPHTTTRIVQIVSIKSDDENNI